MIKHVLSELEIQNMIEKKAIPLWVTKSDLLATVQVRDKTIAEQSDTLMKCGLRLVDATVKIAIMLSALEWIAGQIDTGVFFDAASYARDTIARVKALTVSKQEGAPDNEHTTTD